MTLFEQAAARVAEQQRRKEEYQARAASHVAMMKKESEIRAAMNRIMQEEPDRLASYEEEALEAVCDYCGKMAPCLEWFGPDGLLECRECDLRNWAEMEVEAAST